MALIHQRRTLLIQDAAHTSTQELGRRIGNTRHLDVISHVGVEPPRHCRVISADHFQGHMLLGVGPIGHRCLTDHFLDVIVRPESW